MPPHHFTTPKVVYLGLAYGAKAPQATRATARSRVTTTRTTADRVALRRAPLSAPDTIR